MRVISIKFLLVISMCPKTEWSWELQWNIRMHMIIQDELLPTTLYFYRKCIKSKTREFKFLYIFILGSKSCALVNYFGSFLSGRMEQYCPPSMWPAKFESRQQHHDYYVGVSYYLLCSGWEVFLQVLSFSPLLKNQIILIHCRKHLQLMILGTLTGPQVYQFSDLLSVHCNPLSSSSFCYYCLSKNCFLAVDLASVYQGTTNLGQNRWRNRISLPSPKLIVSGDYKSWIKQVED